MSRKHAWRTLSRKTVLKHGKYLTVENRTVQLPGGRVIKNWSWVTTPDFVNVVAVTEKGRYEVTVSIPVAVLRWPTFFSREG